MQIGPVTDFALEATVAGESIEVEARINTLNQGGRNIDGLFDLWLINRQDPSKYVQVGLFGDLWDTRLAWYFFSSDEWFSMPEFPYASDTWYKLRISGTLEENLKVSIWNDAGTAELVSYVFGQPLAHGASRQLLMRSTLKATKFTRPCPRMVCRSSSRTALLSRARGRVT